MLASVLVDAGLGPSYLIGGDLNETGGGAGDGPGDVFVFEADESDGSFLLGSPAVGVITNVDVDHVDFYPGGRGEIERAFARFASGCGVVVACADDEGASRAVSLAGVDSVTYGFASEARYAVRRLVAAGVLRRTGQPDFEVVRGCMVINATKGAAPRRIVPRGRDGAKQLVRGPRPY